MKVCVIGAGASGLPAIKVALENGFEVVCLEMSEDIGGLWRFKSHDCEGEGSVMKNTVINTSKCMTAYSDFPPDENVSNYMHNTELLKYFRSYASHFDLLKHIIFKRKVININRDEKYHHNGRWEISYVNLETGETGTLTVDGVMVCSGHHTDRYWPNEFAGQKDFKGKIMHSHEYKDCQGFEDKVVVVVGIGNSGVDIATDLKTKKVYLSTRSGSWIMNRVADGGEPSDQVYLNRFNYFIKSMVPNCVQNSLLERKLNQRFDHGRFGLKPNHRFLSAHVTINDELSNRLISGTTVIKPNISSFTENGIIFDDGTVVEQVDIVIFATGYSFSFPFLENGNLIKVKENEVDLYKFMYLPSLSPHNSLAIIGLIQPLGSIGCIAELQCRVFCSALAKRTTLPSEEEMIKDMNRMNLKNRQIFVKSRRHSIQVHYVEYCDGLASLIKVKPNISKYLFTSPKLFKTLIFHGLYPYQYRLNGEGAWDGAKDAILGAEDSTFYCTMTRKTNETLKSKPCSKLYVCKMVGFC
uniref:Flavin-containing monooxygenase n=1 Tax=Rhabditophanes sp. KR3021 TaxID=114890 RepID=A0AC35UA68_9BILA